MANSEDPDQTAPSGAVWSGSALFAYVILSDTLVFEILGHLPYRYFSDEKEKPLSGAMIIFLFFHNFWQLCTVSVHTTRESAFSIHQFQMQSLWLKTKVNKL